MGTGRAINRNVVDGLAAGQVAWDPALRGFGVRRQRRDAVYILKYRDKDGRQRIWTIGRDGPGEWSPTSARREAERVKGFVRDSRDPAKVRDEEKTAPTVAAFCERYLAEYVAPRNKPKTRSEYERRLRSQILPALGPLKLRDVQRSHVAKLHASMVERPVEANRVVDLLSTILNWAERVGERPDHSNPCRHVERYPEKARERLLAPAELARLGDALKTSSEDWRAVAAIRLLCLTGGRKGEILTLQWDWIDAARGVARLPDSKTGAKNLYLPPGALAVLDALPRRASSPYVLPGDRQGGHFIGLQKVWQRLRKTVELDDVHLHDFRHNLASVAIASGDSLYIVGKLLGHRNSATTERYSHVSPDPILAVANRTAERIEAMMSGGKAPEGDVIPLRTSGRR